MLEDEFPALAQRHAQAEPDRNQTPASLVLRTSVMAMTFICSIYAIDKLAAPTYNALLGDYPGQNVFAATVTAGIFVNLPVAAIRVSDPLAKKVIKGIKALPAYLPSLSGCASFFYKDGRDWNERDSQREVEMQSLTGNGQDQSPLRKER